MGLIIPPIESQSFEWFTILSNENDDSSKIFAFLAKKLIYDINAKIKINNIELRVEKPIIECITTNDKRYDQANNYVLSSYRYKYYEKPFTEALELEFGFKPDMLGFYLSQPSQSLEKGIYILVDRIISYSKTIDIDSNIILSLVFLHEYGHLIYDLIQRTIRLKRCDKVHDEFEQCLEEVFCEGIPFTVLPKSMEDHVCTGMFYRTLTLRVDTTCNNISIIKLANNVTIEIHSATQLLSKEEFLNMIRPYPYKLVKNYFINGEDLGWFLISQYNKYGKCINNMILSNSEAVSSLQSIKPKVFIVISDASLKAMNICITRMPCFNGPPPGMLY